MTIQEQTFITIFLIHKKWNRKIGKVKTKYIITIEFLHTQTHTHDQHKAETKVRFQVTHVLAKQ